MKTAKNLPADCQNPVLLYGQDFTARQPPTKAREHWKPAQFGSVSDTMQTMLKQMDFSGELPP